MRVTSTIGGSSLAKCKDRPLSGPTLVPGRNSVSSVILLWGASFQQCAGGQRSRLGRGTSTAAAGGAFLWTPQTGMENLGDLHTGHDISLSHALDINQHGTVIGGSLGWIYFAGEYEMVPPRAFVWTRRTGMLALDDLVPADGPSAV